MISRYFKFEENQTSVRQELLGGLTTFVTMAYIVVVNPQILAQAGMPADGVVFATCLSAAAATLVMGLYANYPIALAPGMSLNAYFTYSVCLAMHIPWRTALAVVFFSGVLFLVLTVTKVREQIVNGMPDCLKHSTAAGIGMFIAFVGLRNAKLVVANSATFVGLGSFADKEVQTACFGLALTLILMARKIHGAILIGIIGTTVLGMLRGFSTRVRDPLRARFPHSSQFGLLVADPLCLPVLLLKKPCLPPTHVAGSACLAVFVPHQNPPVITFARFERRTSVAHAPGVTRFHAPAVPHITFATC